MSDVTEEIASLEAQLVEMTSRLNQLKQSVKGREIPNYSLLTQQGETTLLDCFGDRDRLLVIHNMGQACRYCTLWADGINGFLPHLESAMAVVLVSKDPPETQRLFANSRGWRFRLASHAGSNYQKEQGLSTDGGNLPGAVTYERQGDTIFRKNAAIFGPGDLYCSAWNLLGLAGLTEKEWTPQYNYWIRPDQLEDGGNNVLG